jgi:hypothetical protein
MDPIILKISAIAILTMACAALIYKLYHAIKDQAPIKQKPLIEKSIDFLILFFIYITILQTRPYHTEITLSLETTVFIATLIIICILTDRLIWIAYNRRLNMQIVYAASSIALLVTATAIATIIWGSSNLIIQSIEYVHYAFLITGTICLALALIAIVFKKKERA